MKRRTFLKSTVGTIAAASVGALVGPVWLRRAFGDTSIEPPPGSAPPSVVESLRHAKQYGRPALLFVIPEDAVSVWERGHLYGEYLNNADDEQLAPLALVDLACAKMSDLRAAGVSLAGGREPLVVVVERDGKPHALDGEVPPWADLEQRTPAGGRDPDAGVLARRVAVIANLVRQGVVADSAAVAAQAQAALKEGRAAAQKLKDSLAGGGVPSLADVEVGAALVFEAAARADKQRRKTLIAALAEFARRHYRIVPPPGAKWASSFGCGTDIEGEEPALVGCGMGHVPEGSQRFLYLMTETAAQQRGKARKSKKL